MSISMMRVVTIIKQLNDRFPLFQIAVWTYPVIALAVFNQEQIGIIYSLRSLVLLIILAIVVGLLTRWMYHSPHKGALANTLLGLLFSTYGHLYLKIEYLTVSGILIGRHRYLIIAWIFLALALLWLVKKLPTQFPTVITALGIMSIALIALPLIRGGITFAENQGAEKRSRETGTLSTAAVDVTLPDIYFIVLDAYSRQEFVLKNYAYDNSDFLDFLRQNGFYVADCSQSNYNHTWFSISTSLNLNYLDVMFPDGQDVRPVPYIKHSLMRQKLEELGYKIVAFETGYAFTEITDADYYFQPAGEINLIKLFIAKMNAFELLYGQTTAISAGLELQGISLADMKGQIKRDRMEYIYRQLPDVPDLPGPKFVYAHIDTTHPPFVYSEEDLIDTQEEFVEPQFSQLGNQMKGYGISLAYSDTRIKDIVTIILEKSKVPPIIIIEGDHGIFLKNDKEENLSNLSAVYLGGTPTNDLYPDITPVNVFRIVANYLFDDNYPLLEDVSYFSPASETLSFKVVPNSCTK